MSATITTLTTPQKIIAAFIARVQETGDIPGAALYVANLAEDQMIDLGADPDEAMDAKVTTLTLIARETARVAATVKMLAQEVAR